MILDAAETVLTGRRPIPVTTPIGRPTIPVPQPAGDLTDDGPAYEVMYLLDAEDDRILGLKRDLAPLGDSLVVVGGDGLFNVHVHVDDVGAAIEAGIRAGRPYRVRVTHFAEQVAEARQESVERRGRRIVTVAAGPGLAALFAEAGAVVVEGGPGRRPSTGQILEAITTCGAEEVVVLPNDPDSVRAAEVAARTAESDEKLTVAVIPTRAQVQGLAALAVHEPGRTFQQDVLEMTATARHARHGAVTVAARRAITMAGPCEPGDVLGVVEGDFAVIGDDLYSVATDVLGLLLGGGGELVTLVTGEGETDDLARRCAVPRRGAPPPCRRRRVRRWSGALPAPHLRGVRPLVRDHPRLTGGQCLRQGHQEARRRHQRARPRDRRRPAVPLPASLRQDRRALGRGRTGRGPGRQCRRGGDLQRGQELQEPPHQQAQLPRRGADQDQWPGLHDVLLRAVEGAGGEGAAADGAGQPRDVHREGPAVQPDLADRLTPLGDVHRGRRRRRAGRQPEGTAPDLPGDRHGLLLGRPEGGPARPRPGERRTRPVPGGAARAVLPAGRVHRPAVDPRARRLPPGRGGAEAVPLRGGAGHPAGPGATPP